MENRAYNTDYLRGIIDDHEDLFYNVDDWLPGVDQKWFIEEYMRSEIRSRIDYADRYWVNKLPGDLAISFIEEECDNVYKRGESYEPYPFFAKWLASIYCIYQWYYNVKSRELIELLPLNDMEKYFSWGHTVDEVYCVKRLHTDVLGLDDG